MLPPFACTIPMLSRSTLSRLQGKAGAGEMGYPFDAFMTIKQMVFALFRLLSHVPADIRFCVFQMLRFKQNRAPVHEVFKKYTITFAAVL